MHRVRLTALAALAALLAGALGARASAAATASAPPTKGVETRSLDFLIYKPSTAILIGRGRYTVTVSRDAVAIDGRNDFLDGERDVERERLRSVGRDPQLVSYEHSFFDAHGAPQRAARFNAQSGLAACISYSDDGRSSERSEVLHAPPDTYAGASVLVPIADQLKRNSSGTLELHVFDCASEPRIFSLRVDMEQAPWSYLPRDGDLVKADARPVFGWLDVFLKPFVPEIRMWFDPRRNFGFMGGLLARYYRGPEVMLVRIPPTLAVPPLGAIKPATTPTTPRKLAAAGPTGTVATPSATPGIQ